LNATQRVRNALKLLEPCWTGAILHALIDGELRFGELRSRLDGISDRVLSRRLNDLEEQGLVICRVSTAKPRGPRYSLTLEAEQLGPIFALLGEWNAPSLSSGD